MSKNNANILLQEFLSTIETIGVDETIKALSIARKETLSLQDKRIDFLVKMICQSFNVSPDEVFTSKDRNTNRLFAFKFIVYYLYEAFDFSYPDISLVTHKDVAWVYRCHKELENILLDKKNSLQKKFSKFDLLINEFKLNNKYE
jgi:hypothetical protein